MSSTPSPSAAEAVRAYAAHARATLPEGVHVRSYAGVWLLLAALGPVTAGPDRSKLEALLGLPVAWASDLARRLADERRDDVTSAVGSWLLSGVTLSGRLPVQLDDLPGQKGLDAWARDATRGLVDRFPVTLTPQTVLVLASALTARTRWREPLETSGDGWLEVAEDGLLAVVETEACGQVAVAVPPADGGLDVVSVIADPELPADWVWAAVDEVAGWVLDGSLRTRRIPAADLGAGHAWSVVRRSEPVAPGSTATEVWSAAVPAWTCDTSTDLRHAPGVALITSAVLSLVPGQPGSAVCVQSATASYTARGFEAAAVTAMDLMSGSGPVGQIRKLRRVRLTFDRPHAVVALARGGAWEGVPLVHAWVDGRTDPTLRG